MTVPVTNRRRKLVTAVIVAGILSILGTGSYLTWSASADERPAPGIATAPPLARTINVDSLYTAKAEEKSPVDSASEGRLLPERTIAGRISWYGPGFHGRRTANGERFDKNEMTAAHKTLPFGTIVRVVDDATGQSVLVRVNDRGPYCGGRVLDLSEAAARRLGITGRGTASARLEIYAPGRSAQLTYDAHGNAVNPHGYTVRVASKSGFDEAIALQQRLEKDGHEDVFLTVKRDKSGDTYVVSVGLFSSEHLCNSLLTEVNDAFANAAVIGFDHVAEVAPRPHVADSSSRDRANI